MPDVPTAVILNEAVELASAYSTDDSGRFVNGVLATLAEQVEADAAPGRRREPSGRRPGDPAGRRAGIVGA